MLFLVFLLAGVSFSQSRACLPGQALEMGVCNSCEDSRCANCEDGSASCKECNVGFFLNSEGQCQDCDLKIADTICESCSSDGSKITCDRCAPGFRLQDGKCEECSDACSKCNTNYPYDCLECSEGYRLSQG